MNCHLEHCYASVVVPSCKLCASSIFITWCLNDNGLKRWPFGTQRMFNALQEVPSARTAGVSFIKIALPPFAYKTQAVLKH